ncbi:hypothetical protein L21SP5_02825 [Salinivirga cyanobacteriivorans]|uniref:Coiled coil domain-containing protein n=1 Tax=Salinivirga cyanobacteriivorans TaxID=1307839 RepID=A0A0S2I2I3_9BACT|nr:hypothetical protein [Salinivirga cyanobacteriivorans]ALO16445.1 hypothetical protein L21SP5_02825 [Salinivirga cyanobacteriivorans]
MDKETYKAKAKKSIDDIFNKIDELEAKKHKAQESAKQKYNEKIEDLKARKQELQEKYDELTNATEERWEIAKTKFSESADYFNKGFAELGNIFK